VALRIIAFVVPLGLDTFALAIALGLRGFRPWKAAVVFTIFEGVMPLFGIALARAVSRRFETDAVIAGGVVLLAVATHAIWEAVRGEEEVQEVSFGSLRSSIFAGLAISTDELAIGFPLGASGLPIDLVLLAIVVQTVIFATVGIATGNRVRSDLALSASRYAGIGAGAAFAAVGLWLIFEAVGRH
jgi:putative Mn2+ efflux pump MntP